MGRTTGGQLEGRTEFLGEAMARVERDAGLRLRAEKAMDAAAEAEPLIHEGLRAPQTPPRHTEGPFVRDHVRLMLMSLYAVADGTLRLAEIEELARAKGFLGEWAALNEVIRANVPLLETFALCHDAAAWAFVYFDAPEGSRGRAEGFAARARSHREDAGISERARERGRYLALFESFSRGRGAESPAARADAFYREYRIEAHGAAHDRAIHAPAYRALLGRDAARRGLSPADASLLETLIAHHLEPVADFVRPNAAAIPRYRALGEAAGTSPDAFLSLLQACLFLDTVCGTRPSLPEILVNFARAEHDHAPWRRAERARIREEASTRRRNALFREAGLDGVALMDLLGMDPGPKFGAELRRVHHAIVAGATLPGYGARIDKELERRVASYYGSAFVPGE